MNKSRAFVPTNINLDIFIMYGLDCSVLPFWILTRNVHSLYMYVMTQTALSESFPHVSVV